MGEDRRGGSDLGATDRATGRRLTVPEAAEALGEITADAVRSRIKRGTLRAERGAGDAPPRSDVPGPQTGAERCPWWRRVFGG